MPIIGVTDQRAAFPRLGVLRKGAPKPEKGPGKDLTFFRFVSDDQNAVQAFIEAYGTEPRRINIYLPFATKDENLEAWMEEWGAGSLKHRCNGETCVIWQDDSGLYHDDPKPCPGKCKPVGRLMVIVPEFERLAYVQVLTTSWWDCQELAANLAAAEETVALMGRDLRGVPFVLTRVPRMISTPPRQEGGKRVRAEKWLLHIEPAPTWVKLQIEAARQQAVPQIEAPEDIPPPNGDTVEAETREVESPEETPAAEEPPQKKNGADWPQRPWDPETVKRVIQTVADKWDNSDEEPPEEDSRATVICLAKISLNDDNRRYALTEFLTDGKVRSSKDLTPGEKRGIRRWVGATRENGWEPNPNAVNEAEAIYRRLGIGVLEQDEIPF